MRRRRGSRATLVLLVCCLALAILATSLASRQGTRTPPVASGTIVWGGRVFTTPHQLEQWLKSRGIDYRAWVRRHPDAAAAQKRPQRVVPRRSDSVQRVVVAARVGAPGFLVAIIYALLPFRLSRRRLSG